MSITPFRIVVDASDEVKELLRSIADAGKPKPEVEKLTPDANLGKVFGGMVRAFVEPYNRQTVLEEKWKPEPALDYPKIREVYAGPHYRAAQARLGQDQDGEARQRQGECEEGRQEEDCKAEVIGAFINQQHIIS